MRVVLAANRYSAVSETFIRRHAEQLGDHLVAFFSGGEMLMPDMPAWVRSGARAASLWHWAVDQARSSIGLPSWSERVFADLLDQARPNVVLFEFATVAARFCGQCAPRRIPFAIHFHGHDVLRLECGPDRQALRLAAEAAAVTLVNSDFTGQRVRAAAPGVAPVLKYLGVGIPDTITPLPDRSPFRICHLGRLVDVKGPLSTIKAFSLLAARRSDVELHVVGDGVLRRDCRQLVQERRIPGVFFHGATPDGLAVLRRCHVLTLHYQRTPAGYCEGFGVVCAEAGALCRAVVTTRHGPIPEVVVDGETGLLVAEGDVAAQAQALERLAGDTDLCRTLGLNGYRRVTEHFSDQEEGRQLVGLLQSVASGNTA